MTEKTMNRKPTNAQAMTLISGLLLQGEEVRFVAHGPSMTPVIHSGDSVRIVPPGNHKVAPGTILLFRQHKRLILHRLIRLTLKNGQYCVAADAATKGLDTIRTEDIIGIAKSVIRNEREQPLDTRSARWRGLLRYYMRPARKAIQPGNLLKML